MLDKLAFYVGSIVLSAIFTFGTLFLIAFVADLLDRKNKKVSRFMEHFFN